MQKKHVNTAIIIMVVAALVIVGVRWRMSQLQHAIQVAEEQASFNGAIFDPPAPAPNIVLTDHTGQSFSLHDQKGNVVVLFFGFTYCPDVCPTTLAHFKQVKQHLGQDADRVRFIMVSVDPERDTPERMGQYVTAFDPDFIGLTGTLAEARVAWQAYDVHPEKIEIPGSAAGYTVSHPAWTYVIDPEGQLRLMHFYDMPADAVSEDLQKLLT